MMTYNINNNNTNYWLEGEGIRFYYNYHEKKDAWLLITETKKITRLQVFNVKQAVYTPKKKKKVIPIKSVKQYKPAFTF